MDLKLQGKTAFISGSTAGIGLATAQLLLSEGAEVIINGRDEEALQRVVKELEGHKYQGSVSGLCADFADEQSVKNLLVSLPSIDILVNNVGIYASKSFFDTVDEDWERQQQVNVMSGVRLSRALLPGMLAKDWGRIIFISSECANLVPADLIAYSATKAAMLAISRGLAQLTVGSGVTVNAIMPGSTMTAGAQKFMENLARSNQQTVEEAESVFFRNERPASLLQRFATEEEVASSIVYHASPLASATNGACIKVEGGSTGGIL